MCVYRYRLAQQRSDSEESVANTAPSRAASPASPSPPRGSCASLCEPSHRFIRKDRELMRKSALLRRLWARPNCNPCYYCNGDSYDSQGDCGRETRSLDGSRSELRHLSGSLTSSRYSRESHMVTGWLTPKRQRLESPNNSHGSDEMLRIAMRNSYDRAEEIRSEKDVHHELSDSTFQSHDHGVSSNIATSSETQFTDSTKSNNSRNTEESSDGIFCDCTTAKITSDRPTSHESNSSFRVNTEKHFCNETETTLSTSTIESNGIIVSQNKQDRQKYINLQINEVSEGNENNQAPNILNRDKSLIKTPYEFLEIVVSETLNTSAFDQDTQIKNISPKSNSSNLSLKNNFPVANKNDIHGIDLDEYVSNILVESLNSLTDQIENMNASIGCNRKISIVEKEIKVKLQNTGVNTIVHLSPTSNNQIIFGNEELYNNEEDKDYCNNIQEQEVPIRDEVNSIESNNNYSISTEVCKDKKDYINEGNYSNNTFEPIIQHDNVNKAVLQQIQKLFQDEMQNMESENFSANTLPTISHIEISNVDVFIEENASQAETDTNSLHNECKFNEQCQDVISSVGSGNYFIDIEDPVVVPRFSALPHSDSMEVNTSSSDDVDIIGSECPSLVDSLDDPNSPRSMLQKRSYNKRSELVRSAIDVLDLLPEGAFLNESQPKEKSEAFFIRIKDNDCDCEKENIIVAEHMPEKIKERLYRRHKKRELRMECAKRKKIKQYKLEIDKQRNHESIISKKEIEKDCVAVLNSLINEVIAKIAQEEYKYMRIKQKSNNNNFINKKLGTPLKNETSQKRSTWKKDGDSLSSIGSSKKTKYRNLNLRNIDNNKNDYSLHDHIKRTKERHQVYGKLSLQTHPPIISDEKQPKRIYQKSEIHDGNKCIEILEILEYVSSSQSSPETTNSDENLNSNYSKNRKSRIPIPIYERVSTLSNKKIQRAYKSSPILNYEETYKSNCPTNICSDILDNDINLNEAITKDKYNNVTSQMHPRRASVPHETRSRSNSLRFKQVFDIIPEEKSSLSVESPSEDINYNRRVSAPNLSGNFIENNNNENNLLLKSNNVQLKKDVQNQAGEHSPLGYKDTKSIGTSPMSDNANEATKSSSQKFKNKNIMTSPPRKSAATSPLLSRVDKDDKCGITNNSSAKKSLSSHGTKAGWLGFYKPNKQVLENEGIKISCAPCH